MHQLGMFDYVYFAMFCASFAIRAPFEHRSRRTRFVESRDRRKEGFKLMLVFTGSVTMPALHYFSRWFRFADYEVGTACGFIGSALAAAGLLLFWKSHHDLGRQFSPQLEMKESHALVSRGIYRRIRHPMYTAVFLLAGAQLLLLGNWVVGPAFLLAFWMLYLTRIEREEQMMLDHFGPAYAEYQQRTNRLIPSLRTRA